MKTIFVYLLLFTSLLLINSCQSKKQMNPDILTIDVRYGIKHNKPTISLDDDIKSIEYIPLETNDSCLIGNILDLRISEDYIFIYNGKASEVLQFDKKGHFVRQIGREGNGPGEYSMITELAIDDAHKKVFIFQYSGAVLTYSFEGEFLCADTVIGNAGGMYVFSDGMRALKGLTMNPIKNAPWAGALIDDKGKIIISKSLYPTMGDVNLFYMKEICFSPFKDEVLLFTSCNDTVFCINSSSIQPRFLLNRSNEAYYYNAVSDITKMDDLILNDLNTIGIYDLFETYRYLYIRIYKGNDIYIQRYNKENAHLESYCVPNIFVECSSSIPGNNVVGIETKITKGIPFWPEFYISNGTRAQIVSSYSISMLKDKKYIYRIPSQLNIKENDNPLIVIYTFKE